MTDYSINKTFEMDLDLGFFVVDMKEKLPTFVYLKKSAIQVGKLPDSVQTSHFTSLSLVCSSVIFLSGFSDSI